MRGGVQVRKCCGREQGGYVRHAGSGRVVGSYAGGRVVVWRIWGAWRCQLCVAGATRSRVPHETVPCGANYSRPR